MSRFRAAYRGLNNLDRAEEAYKKAIQLDPDNVVYQASLDAINRNKLQKQQKTTTPSENPKPATPPMRGDFGDAASKRDELNQMPGPGFDFSKLSGLLNNPEMLNMASQMMNDPEMMRGVMNDPNFGDM